MTEKWDGVVIRAIADEPNKRVPARIDALFAKAGVAVPHDDRKISIYEVDVALKGLSIEARLEIKGQLRALALID